LETVSIEDLMAKLSDRSKDFIVEALKRLEREGLIEVNAGMIQLTDKAAKNLLSLSEKRMEKGM
jgi:Mn-dependent DtxR family transcriptional regulator